MSKDQPIATTVRALEQMVYHAVMEFAPWPMAEVEGKAHLVQAVNPAFCALLEKSEEELLGKPIAQIFKEGHATHGLLDRVQLSGEAATHVESASNTPGSKYWSYTCWPVRAGDGLHVGLMIQVSETSLLQEQTKSMNEALLISSLQQHELTDVADRLNMQLVQEIAERQKAEIAANRLAAIVSYSADAIFSTDPDGIITSWNSGAEGVFGYTASEIVGNSIMRMIPDDRRDEEKHILSQVNLGQSAQHFETVRRTKDGRSINVSVTTSPIMDATGKVIGASKVTRDITEQKQLELELEQTVKDLAEVDRRKSEFLATLAHELRNPLAPLRNGLELLSMADHDRATWDQAHGMMKRQLDQMVRLIDELMDLSRISRGVIELRKERLDLRMILEQAVEASRTLIERQDHALVLDMPEEPLMVEGDAMRLTQVFCNLLNNAAKYTDQGGAIAMHASAGTEAVTVTVEDNGIGIAPDQLEKVFDMFAQVERTNDRVQGGLGIGLNIVKHLVGMHGGRITARSGGLGNGSGFSVMLPLAPAFAPPIETAEATSRISAPPVLRRILVVDDNEDAATLMAMLLTKLGHEVLVAHNGAEALEQGVQLRPHLVLMDLGMPVMDGYTACSRMRKTPWGLAALIVALSGWGQLEDRDKSRLAGFDHHLVKPIASADVLALLPKDQGTVPR